MTTEQQLPEGWKIERLGDVIDIQGGSQPPKSEFIYEPMEGYIQLLQIRDFGENGIPTFVPQNRVTKFCDKDDILIARYGASLGRIVTGLAGAYNVALAKTIFDKNLLIKRFVYYLLQTQIFQVPLKMISRSAQNGFAKHEIAHIEIPVPPIETQQAIVNKIESLFDEIDEGIGRLKTAAQQIQQYRQSLLKNAFNGELTKEWRSKHADALPSENELLAQIQTAREQHHAQQLADWQNITIGEVVTISPKKEKAIDDDTDVSFSSMHLMSSSLSEHLTYEIKKWADVKKGFTVFRNNDVLLAKITPCFENGKSAVAQDLINGIGTGSTEFMVLRSSNQILPKFLYFLVNTPDFRQAGIHNMTGSVGHKRVPKDFVSTWAFSLPPLAEQTEIVAILESKLNACDQLAAELSKQLKQAELLKQAVLKAAFSGSLLDK